MRLLTTFRKDMMLSYKGFYVYIEIAMALIFVAVLLFVVPENFDSKREIYVSVENNMDNDIISLENDEVIYVKNKDEIIKALGNNRNAIGMVLSKKENRASIEYILQGFESEKYVNILKTSVVGEIRKEITDIDDLIGVKKIGSKDNILSDRMNILPVILTFNAAFMGLFIIAAYVFLDKREGTIKALAVTPAKVWEYLLSKLMVILTTGILSTLIVVIFVAGLEVNYFHLIMLTIVANAFGSSLGLFIASFFDSLQKSMGGLYVMIIILAAASISYFMPAYSPWYIKILPSYPILFAFKETFMQKPDIQYIYSTFSMFLVLTVLFFLLATIRFKKTITV